MLFFSSWIKAIFIIALAFPFYSESAVARKANFRRPPNCKRYTDHCTKEYDPVCGTNKKTYSNQCIFCFEKKKSNKKFDFGHFGRC